MRNGGTVYALFSSAALTLAWDGAGVICADDTAEVAETCGEQPACLVSASVFTGRN